ncbi:nucleoside triphosphate pyrophosphohydrolase [Kroppenstedtia eburnea]|uniref:Tetrapyrrole methylase family protein / MazG family protein n=1 Tax=Kroppenstedtia eburnea TaxID=714067 RepID=A0A1N7MTQ6_9BACL|nr:nucleoside triphosphate pyrophosphohydrolase [Kroppenstedtia eburnea]QKI80652.1 nucleoside triphosphate pyrophosphohydrolase [Kroppenstedtia eburnea]SIS89476.1 tetrapyrrole methylase family protein / MazG family protein [Kroppenstedtia eburnea]
MGKITVVGLGPGDEDGLSLGVFRLLTQAEDLWLRTGRHPVVSWLEEEGISYRTFDSVYEKHTDFPSVYREIADELLVRAREGNVVYAVPGHPMVAEKTVEILRLEGSEQGVPVEVKGGASFLDAVFTCVGVDPVDGFLLLDGTALEAGEVNPRVHQLITQVYDRMIASEVKLTLMEVYPDDTPVTVVTAAGVPGQERVEQVPLYLLDRKERFGNLSTVYIPPSSNPDVLHRQFSTLVEIIAHLRAPEGCPWDRKQTHESLRPYLLEESYEFLEAVAEGDPEGMADELGDVLLQVLLHAQIASETGEFAIGDVVKNLADKLIRRHPHVFGEESVEDETDVKRKWEEIKARERGEEEKSLLEGIPGEFPALARALKLQRKAAGVGFDWDSTEGVRDKIEEELAEVFTASPAEREEEVGDLFFTIVALARFFQVDPEQALLGACRKFVRRFHHLEAEARRRGRPVKDFPLTQLDAWWEQAKEAERRGQRNL